MTVKTKDLIKQLQANLPRFTDDFNLFKAMTACTSSGNDLTIAPFIANMTAGVYITLTGLKLKNNITEYTFDNGKTTVKNQYKNDLTMNFHKSVDVLDGTTVTEYDLLEVIDDYSFVISTPSEIDFVGQQLIEAIAGYNKQWPVKSVSASDFVIDIGNPTQKAFYVTDAKIVYGFNIKGIGLGDEIDSYITSSTIEVDGVKAPHTSVKPTLWVRMVEERVSQDVHNFDDGNKTTGENQQTLCQNIKQFEIVLTYPLNGKLTSFAGLSFAEDLKVYLDKCLFGLKLPSYVETSMDQLLMPLSNAPFETNGAIYQHSYLYEIAYKTQNDDEDHFDGVDEESVDLKKFNIQYLMQFDDFEEVKKEDDFVVSP